MIFVNKPLIKVYFLFFKVVVFAELRSECTEYSLFILIYIVMTLQSALNFNDTYIIILFEQPNNNSTILKQQIGEKINIQLKLCTEYPKKFYTHYHKKRNSNG
jgi:hypothetical protein